MIRHNRQNAQAVFPKEFPNYSARPCLHRHLQPTAGYLYVGNRMARHGIVVVTMKGWCVRVPPIPTYYFLDSD